MSVNPFIFGKDVSGDNFCNREQEIAELTQDIRNRANVLIYSPRRYGKTSLIKRVLDIIAQEGFITVYIDLYPAITKEKFIEIYAGAISKSIQGNIEKALSWMKKAVPKLIPKVIARTEELEMEFEFDKSRSYTPIYNDLFEAVNKRTNILNKPAVVVFDEFQEINNYPDDEIEKEMRSAFQTHSNVSYIFMGSKRHIVQEMFENSNRPFYRSTKHVPIKKINKDVFAEFINKKFHRENYDISTDCILKILEITECHPHYTQQLCYFLWDQEQDSKKITQDSINSAVKRTIEVENQGFINLWESLSQKQRQLLVVIAKDNPTSIYSNDFLQKYQLGHPSSIQKAVSLLIKREILLKENGLYTIEDIFFKQWIIEFFA